MPSNQAEMDEPGTRPTLDQSSAEEARAAPVPSHVSDTPAFPPYVAQGPTISDPTPMVEPNPLTPIRLTIFEEARNVTPLEPAQQARSTKPAKPSSDDDMPRLITPSDSESESIVAPPSGTQAHRPTSILSQRFPRDGPFTSPPRPMSVNGLAPPGCILATESTDDDSQSAAAQPPTGATTQSGTNNNATTGPVPRPVVTRSQGAPLSPALRATSWDAIRGRQIFAARTILRAFSSFKLRRWISQAIKSGPDEQKVKMPCTVQRGRRYFRYPGTLAHLMQLISNDGAYADAIITPAWFTARTQSDFRRYAANKLVDMLEEDGGHTIAEEHNIQTLATVRLETALAALRGLLPAATRGAATVDVALAAIAQYQVDLSAEIAAIVEARTAAHIRHDMQQGYSITSNRAIAVASVRSLFAQVTRDQLVPGIPQTAMQVSRQPRYATIVPQPNDGSDPLANFEATAAPITGPWAAYFGDIATALRRTRGDSSDKEDNQPLRVASTAPYVARPHMPIAAWELGFYPTVDQAHRLTHATTIAINDHLALLETGRVCYNYIIFIVIVN